MSSITHSLDVAMPAWIMWVVIYLIVGAIVTTALIIDCYRKGIKLEEGWGAWLFVYAVTTAIWPIAVGWTIFEEIRNRREF